MYAFHGVYIKVKRISWHQFKKESADMDQEVVVYFHPENIIRKMHLYLDDTLEHHYEALKKRGWVVKEPLTGKRKVFRSEPYPVPTPRVLIPNILSLKRTM